MKVHSKGIDRHFTNDEKEQDTGVSEREKQVEINRQKTEDNIAEIDDGLE